MAATIRPDAWNFPLLLHVLGAMLLVGALVLAASALILARRDGSVALIRLGYRSLLVGVLPSWILMRVGAEWIASKEDLTNSNAAWVGMGVTTAADGIVFIVVAIILAGVAARRAGRAEGTGGGSVLGSAAVVSLLVIAYLFTVWAMTTKPT